MSIADQMKDKINPKKNSQKKQNKGWDVTEQVMHPQESSPEKDWEVDPTDVYRDIVRFLSGKRYDEREGEWEEALDRDKAKVSEEEGLQAVRTTLHAGANKIQSLTDQNKREIERELQDLHNEWFWDLLINHKEYGIDLKDLEYIHTFTMAPIWAGVKRAEKGAMFRYKRNIEKKLKSIRETRGNQEDKGGMLNL